MSISKRQESRQALLGVILRHHLRHILVRLHPPEVIRKDDKQCSDKQHYLFALEEHIGTGRIDGDAVLLQVCRKFLHLFVPDRPEKKRNLVVVGDGPARLQLPDKVDDIVSPILQSPFAGNLYHGRHAFQQAGFGRADRLVITELSPLETADFRVLHPIVVERYNVPLGTVVLHQTELRNAFPLQRKLKNVSYRRTTKTIQTLVVIPDDANITVSLRNQENQPLLDIVSVLILVDHHIPKLFLDFLPDGFVLRKQPISNNLNGREVHRVLFVQQSLIDLIRFRQDLNGRILVRLQLLDRRHLLGN